MVTSKRIQTQHLFTRIQPNLFCHSSVIYVFPISIFTFLPFLYLAFHCDYMCLGRLNGRKEYSGCIVCALIPVSLHVCRCLELCLSKVLHNTELCKHFLIYAIRH